MLQYILEVTLCWALFYLIFFGLLRKLTFFSVNRWYLLGSLILGMLIPQLRHMELNMYQQEISETIPLAIMVKELPAQVAVTVEEVTVEWHDILTDVLWGVYIIGLAFFGFRLLRSLYRIYRLHIDGRQESMEGANIIHTQSEHLPFSFWDTVYISDRVELSEEFQEILEHERAHVKSRHSIDVLLIELIQITFWFNPMIYLYKTALRQTHEYLADAAVLQHTSRKTYGTMLLKQSLSGLEIALTHQFFHSHIKKRINMMYKKKSGRSAWLKYALALPVLFVLTVVFANHSKPSSDEGELMTIETNKKFKEETLITFLTDTNEIHKGKKSKFQSIVQNIVKDYLHEYPKDHRDIITTVQKWGWEHGYLIQVNFDQGNLDKYPYEHYPITDINSFKLYVDAYNHNAINVVESNGEHSTISKENIRKLLDILHKGNINNEEALGDFITSSYFSRRQPNKLEILAKTYREVLKEEKFEGYDDFEKLEISFNELIPQELKKYEDINLDDLSIPVIWTQESILSQSMSEFIDLDKSIGTIYHLPASEATKIFGDRGKNGFYALMDYERPISHPEKQRELLEFEMENFFKTLANDVNEKAWIEKLKEIHKKMQQRYPKVGDWVTPFTTKAHKYNINLVIKDQEIIAAYRNGVERIDAEPKKSEKLNPLQKLMQEKLDFSYSISEHGSSIYTGLPIDKEYIKVSAQGKILKEGIDYTINEEIGSLAILNENLLKKAIPIRVEFGDSHLLHRSIPLFPGCEDEECSKTSLLKYLYANIRYPSSMRSSLIQGTSYIGIHIDEHGNLAPGFTIHESLGLDANAELKTLYDGLKAKGQWKPRVLDHDHGSKVRTETFMLVPVTFRLQDEKKELIDYKRSAFDVPERYNVVFDEIVVTGYANPSIKSKTKN